MIEDICFENGVERLRRLLIAVGHRDEAAFAALYGLTKGKMFAVALAIVRRRDLAEDVMQEAYVRIWHNAARFDPAKGSPISWMATIVRNQAINVVRRPTVEVECDQATVLNVVGDDCSPLDRLQSSQDCSHALAALQALAPLQRRLIVAAYVRGESRDQLAQRFGAPANTIKTWLRRAIMDVRATLERPHENRQSAA
ncbi:MAG: sigma-70 family RNA polymerase sigma factor [Bradyrhizobium sp.]|nr:MAG: sigma-70 family RNA polymerase sigma factor [Bradyrhizobium sp.]